MRIFLCLARNPPKPSSFSPLTRSSVQMEKPYSLAPGAALNYTLQSFSETSMPGEFTIRLALEKFNRQSSRYDEVKTLSDI